MIWALRNWRVIARVAALTGAFCAGYGLCHYILTSAANAALVADLQADADAAEKLAAAEEANRKLSRALEDQAYAEPPVSAVCLPASRVLRLNQR